MPQPGHSASAYATRFAAGAMPSLTVLSWDDGDLNHGKMRPFGIRRAIVTYEIIWEFRVPPHRHADFEAAYGGQGEWARLFAKADGFIEVKLLKCSEQEGRYLTIDRWVSRAAFEAFQMRFSHAYRALDEFLEGMAATETRIGAFVPCSADSES